MRVLVFLLFIALICPASALQLSVSGGCVGEKVTVYTDRDAVVVFQLNGGTPVFSEANSSEAAVFKPQITGTLKITAIAGSERVEKTIEIRICAGGAETRKRYCLPSGEFEKAVDGEVYEFKFRTALGALEMAVRAGEISSYRLKKTEWGPFVDCIEDVCSGYAGKFSGWMYWVNYPDEPLPGVAAAEYRIDPGDTVVWYFSRSMNETPDSSPFVIRIYIDDDYCVHVSKKWATKVPPIARFDFSPAKPKAGEAVTFNASKSFDPDGEIVRYEWDFGDGSSGVGRVVNHTFEKPGRYEVTLKVYDDDGLSDEYSREVIVAAAENVTGVFRKIVNVSGSVELEIGVENVPLRRLTLFGNGEVRLEVRRSSPPEIVYADVYACFEVNVSGSVSADLYIEVPKNWSGVELFKYNGTWVRIPMDVVEEREGSVVYKAHVESFSVFVLAKPWQGFPLSRDDERIRRALGYLRSLQRDSGGFANPGEEESIAKTSWAIMAIVAAGEDPRSWVKNGKSPLDYIEENLAAELPKMGTADFARTILALVAAGEDPRSFAGVDLVEKLKERMKESGQIGDFVYTTIWGITALTAVGENVSKSVEWLKTQQNDDGGFAWVSGERSDFDDTAAAIQALIAAGEPRDSETIKRALEYLKTGQNDDGGMRYFGSSASNAASDAWTIQALVAAGVNPRSWVKNGTSVVDHLLSLQAEDGHFNYTAYQTSNPGYMTACAVMALLGRPHPIRPANVTLLPVETTTVTTTTTATTTATTVATTATATSTVTTAAVTPRTPGFEALIAAAVLAATAVRRR